MGVKEETPKREEREERKEKKKKRRKKERKKRKERRNEEGEEGLLLLLLVLMLERRKGMCCRLLLGLEIYEYWFGMFGNDMMMMVDGLKWMD